MNSMRAIVSVLIICTLILILGSLGGAKGIQDKKADGQTIFRFDTFGDEQLWTDTLRMDEALQSVTPATALGVGLKVDSDALPPSVIQALANKQVHLNNPSVTLGVLALH